MHFFTLAGLGRRTHDLVSGSICSFFLLIFAITCFTDLNHPPGVRYIRLGTLGFILFVSVIEFAFAWRGIGLFCLLWPLQLPIKYFLSSKVSGLFGAIPDLFDWPLAAGFTIAIALRQLRTVPPDPVKIENTQFGAMPRFLPVGLYLFACLIALSAISAYLRLRYAPSSWNVQSADFRMLLYIHNPHSILRVFWVGVPAIVNAFFLLAILRAGLFERTKTKITIWPFIAFVVSMMFAAGIVVSQITGKWYWVQFDDGPPGGPFSNRNAVAPMLILAALAILAFIPKIQSTFFKTMCGLSAVVLMVIAISTGSRNGLVLILLVPWAFLWVGAGLWRVIATTLTPMLLMLMLLYWVPIPKPETVRIESLQRGIEAVSKVRQGNWDEASSYRNQLWNSAFRMASLHPVLGTGPGTYYLYASQVPETRNDLIQKHNVTCIVAHSTPINLLAEGGIITAILWVGIWILIPFCLVVKSTEFNGFSIGVLLLGLSNILDTPWYVSGGITLASIWLTAAIVAGKDRMTSH